MTLTNGQDQSAAFHREQGRQGLERGRKKSILPSHPEGTRSSPSHFSGIEDKRLMLEDKRLMLRLKRRLLEQPSGPTVGIEDKPVGERRGFTAHSPLGSRRKLTGLADGYKSVCQRWSLDALGMAKLLHLEEETALCDLILSGQVPPMTGDLKDRMALVIGISIGLGELFDDDKDAELQWLTSKRADLGGISPLEHLLKGDLLNVRDVVDLVDNARGLR